MDWGVLMVVGVAAWIALSVSVALVLGRMLSVREERERPSRGLPEERRGVHRPV